MWQKDVLIIQDVKDHFLEATRQYCEGALEAVEHHGRGGTLSVEEYMASRRRSAGVTPVIAMVE